MWGPLSIVGTVIVAVGLLMVVAEWWLSRRPGGLAAAANDPIGAIIKAFVDLVNNTIGDPRRWGFTLIAIGALVLIADQVFVHSK